MITVTSLLLVRPLHVCRKGGFFSFMVSWEPVTFSWVPEKLSSVLVKTLYMCIGRTACQSTLCFPRKQAGVGSRLGPVLSSVTMAENFSFDLALEVGAELPSWFYLLQLHLVDVCFCDTPPDGTEHAALWVPELYRCPDGRLGSAAISL